MDGLRWFLLLFGLFVVAGVYLYSRREREPKENDTGAPEAHRRLEPSLTGEPAEGAGPIAEISAKPVLIDEDDAEQAPVEPKQKVITLRIVASRQASFPGDELALTLRGIGMRHGKFGIYHRYDGSDEDKIIFSAASLVEPGSFDLANLKEQKIPGISLFMVLPGPVDGVEAFDLMLVAARALAQSLKAETLDESGSTLSIQRERFIREEIIQYHTSRLVT